MNHPYAPSVTSTPAPRSRRSRVWRPLVMRGLEQLRSGRIELHDGDDVTIHGCGPEEARVIVQVHDPRFYAAVALGGSIGVGESYMDGWWSTSDLVGLLRLFVRDEASSDAIEGGWARLKAPLRRALHHWRSNSRSGSRRNIHAHYDLGNDFFELFLDETMMYSCGIFERPDATLYDASVAKLDRLCRVLDLRPEHHLLEIGTGWGGLALHAAREFGCRVTTTTISDAQFTHARRRVRDAGLEDRIEVRRDDYRDLTGTYDRLISIEMIEAVGHEYLPKFFETCARRVRPGGRMALQAITMPDHRYEQYRRSVDFIQKYVFPGCCVPSFSAMVNAMRQTDWRVVDVHDISPHYATTLHRWRERLQARSDAVLGMGRGPEFMRLWTYYLSYCEAGFAEGYLGDYQLLLTRGESGVHVTANGVTDAP